MNLIMTSCRDVTGTMGITREINPKRAQMALFRLLSAINLIQPGKLYTKPTPLFFQQGTIDAPWVCWILLGSAEAGLGCLELLQTARQRSLAKGDLSQEIPKIDGSDWPLEPWLLMIHPHSMSFEN